MTGKNAPSLVEHSKRLARAINAEAILRARRYVDAASYGDAPSSLMQPSSRTVEQYRTLQPGDPISSIAWSQSLRCRGVAYDAQGGIDFPNSLARKGLLVRVVREKRRSKIAIVVDASESLWFRSNRRQPEFTKLYLAKVLACFFAQSAFKYMTGVTGAALVEDRVRTVLRTHHRTLCSDLLDLLEKCRPPRSRGAETTAAKLQTWVTRDQTLLLITDLSHFQTSPEAPPSPEQVVREVRKLRCPVRLLIIKDKCEWSPADLAWHECPASALGRSQYGGGSMLRRWCPKRAQHGYDEWWLEMSRRLRREGIPVLYFPLPEGPSERSFDAFFRRSIKLASR